MWFFLYNETYDQIYQQVAMFFGKKWALNLEDHPKMDIHGISEETLDGFNSNFFKFTYKSVGNHQKKIGNSPTAAPQWGCLLHP